MVNESHSNHINHIEDQMIERYALDGLAEVFAIGEVCDEEIGLVAKYDAATHAYRIAVEALHSRLGVVPKQTYESMRCEAEAARVRSEEARLAVERHVAQHGC
jgi:hypothetical protein